MLLGVVEDFEYQQTTIRLEEDELLVIHSDGIEGRVLAHQARPLTRREQGVPHAPGVDARGESLDSLLSAMERLGVDLDNQAGSFHRTTT